MLYALLMLAILCVLAALWRDSGIAVPLFLATLVAASVFLALDMTTPLTLSF